MKNNLSTFASISLLCTSLVAMDHQEQHPLGTSLLGSEIARPGTYHDHVGSPLLQSTLRRLHPDGTIRDLQTPVVIDDNATAAIMQGGALMHLILQNPPIDALHLDGPQPAFAQNFNCPQPEHLAAIFSVMWYLYSEAINKQQAFVDGSFIIIDPDFKLYNFLMHYARRFNPTLTGTNADPLSHGSDNPFAYSRDSSHWKTTQQIWSHYGIDMRFAPDQTSQPLLPAGKKHLLFGIVADQPTPRLFIKFEDDGIYGGKTFADKLYNGWELVRHGLSFVKSRVPKQEKNMPQWWYDTLLKPVFGSDEGAEARREHTSVAFTRRCWAILTEHHCPNTTGYYKMLEAHGVSKLGELIENKPADWSPALHEAFRQYYHELCGMLDYPAIRKGCEVILSRDELFSSLYFHFLAQNNDEKAAQAGILYEIVKKHRELSGQLSHLNRTIELALRQEQRVNPALIASAHQQGQRILGAQELLEQQAQQILRRK